MKIVISPTNDFTFEKNKEYYFKYEVFKNKEAILISAESIEKQHSEDVVFRVSQGTTAHTKTGTKVVLKRTIKENLQSFTPE